MSDIIQLPVITTVDIPAGDALDKAKGWDMEHCVIVGHDTDGKLCVGGSTASLEKIITLLRRAEYWCLAEMND